MPHYMRVLFKRLLLIIFAGSVIAACYGDPAGITQTNGGDVHHPYFAAEVLAYRPAPGQFVRSDDYGNPERALGAPDGRVVSLGAFGGELVLKMGSAIVDRPGEPDFVVWGNAFYYGGDPRDRWAEPATVEISSNGVDWILIGGSIYNEEYRPEEARLAVEYERDDAALWPAWADGQTSIMADGFEVGAAFHSRLSSSLSYTNAPWEDEETLFGFADCTPRNTQNPWYEPNDPYSFGNSGSGGDVMFLEWAVDDQGQSVYEAIRHSAFHYVRFRTAVRLEEASLGEFSSEIDAVGRFF